MTERKRRWEGWREEDRQARSNRGRQEKEGRIQEFGTISKCGWPGPWVAEQGSLMCPQAHNSHPSPRSPHEFPDSLDVGCVLVQDTAQIPAVS